MSSDHPQDPDTNEADSPEEERDDIAELFGDETQEYQAEEEDVGEDLFGDDMDR